MARGRGGGGASRWAGLGLTKGALRSPAPEGSSQASQPEWKPAARLLRRLTGRTRPPHCLGGRRNDYFNERAEPASLRLTSRRTCCSGDSCRNPLNQRKRRRRAKRARALLLAATENSSELSRPSALELLAGPEDEETGRLRRGDFPGHSSGRGAVLARPPPRPQALSRLFL